MDSLPRVMKEKRKKEKKKVYISQWFQPKKESKSSQVFSTVQRISELVASSQCA